jgi:hypothetical protein
MPPEPSDDPSAFRACGVQSCTRTSEIRAATIDGSIDAESVAQGKYVVFEALHGEGVTLMGSCVNVKLGIGSKQSTY